MFFLIIKTHFLPAIRDAAKCFQKTDPPLLFGYDVIGGHFHGGNPRSQGNPIHQLACMALIKYMLSVCESPKCKMEKHCMVAGIHKDGVFLFTFLSDEPMCSKSGARRDEWSGRGRLIIDRSELVLVLVR